MIEKAALVDWRRRTQEMYASVRAAAEGNRERAWREWRACRDELFRYHSQSPLEERARPSFREIDYFAYDPAWRCVVAPVAADAGARTAILPEGELRYPPFATVVLPRMSASNAGSGHAEARLTLYWIEGYGGGLFLPFGDATNGTTTYGGGRYLYDTIKGADLGATSEQIVLDFNYAYNPSCSYSPKWVCPLAPKENILPFPVNAGERF